MMAIEMAEKAGKPLADTRIIREKAVSYIAVGGSDWMTGVENDFGIQAMTPQWKIIDREVFQWAATILVEKERMDRAYQIGVNLADVAMDIEHASYKSEPGVCAHCHSRQFYLTPNGMAVCSTCGIEGTLVLHDDGYHFLYDKEQELLAHDTLSGKAKHGKDINENTAREMQALKTPEFAEKKAFYRDYIQPMRPDRF